MIDCATVRELISFSLDREIEAEERIIIEDHVDTCAECRDFFESELILREQLRPLAEIDKITPRFEDEFKRNIRNESIRLCIGRWTPVAMAAVLLAGFLVQNGTTPNFRPLEQATLSHARNLPMDIWSRDTGNVRTYLKDRIPFAIRIPIFERRRDWKLEGARILSIGDRDTAYMRYVGPSGVVSLFVQERSLVGNQWQPGAGGKVSPRFQSYRGYQTVRWSDSGLVYSVVSDVTEPELREAIRSLSFK